MSTTEVVQKKNKKYTGLRLTLPDKDTNRIALRSPGKVLETSLMEEKNKTQQVHESVSESSALQKASGHV